MAEKFIVEIISPDKSIFKNETLNFYVDDGIVEFKDNTLSILTSNIIDLKEMDKNKVDKIVKDTEEGL